MPVLIVHEKASYSYKLKLDVWVITTVKEKKCHKSFYLERRNDANWLRGELCEWIEVIKLKSSVDNKWNFVMAHHST